MLTSKEAFNKLPQKLHNFFIKYPPRPFQQYKSSPSVTNDPTLNPFFPNKNLETGNWQQPKYSRRRSADLFKLAKKFGLQDLLPPTPRKFHEEKYNNVKFMNSIINPSPRPDLDKIHEKMAKRANAIENMDDIISKARPNYKKLISKRKKKEEEWF
ncbi:unnamed protein product [Candida verbasci]|uniref:Large ribosomal subunit protein mL59 domain-containing protein n=1 Tax=Candida verbasci TaxID=1227364 RepID=A0A9W4TSJ3_9ASCO|nr:unnamed protein product [Candida verbasci]